MKTSTKFAVAATFPAVGTAFAVWTAAASGFAVVSALPAFVGLGLTTFLLVCGFGANWAEVAQQERRSKGDEL